MIKRLIEGIKSLTVNGNPVKWIGLSIPVGTMIYVKSVDSPVSFFVFYLAENRGKWRHVLTLPPI